MQAGGCRFHERHKLHTSAGTTVREHDTLIGPVDQVASWTSTLARGPGLGTLKDRVPGIAYRGLSLSS